MLRYSTSRTERNRNNTRHEYNCVYYQDDLFYLNYYRSKQDKFSQYNLNINPSVIKKLFDDDTEPDSYEFIIVAEVHQYSWMSNVIGSMKITKNLNKTKQYLNNKNIFIIKNTLNRRVKRKFHPYKRVYKKINF